MYVHTQTLIQRTEFEIRALNPNTSFPSPFIPPEGYEYVFPVPVPVHDPVTQTINQTTPELTVLGKWEQRWEVVELYQDQSEKDAAIAASLVPRRAAFIRQIDADTDAIYRAVQGDRAMEYLQAEQEARQFKKDGYAGDVPDSVASWASAKGETATWATDDILTTARGWRQAQSAIRATRLTCKEQARAATDLAPVVAQWAGFLVAVKAALGVA